MSCPAGDNYETNYSMEQNQLLYHIHMNGVKLRVLLSEPKKMAGKPKHRKENDGRKCIAYSACCITVSCKVSLRRIFVGTELVLRNDLSRIEKSAQALVALCAGCRRVEVM